MNIASSVTELIGNTPLLKINSLSDETGTVILGKCEFMNPGGSVKDRIAKNMIEAALADGRINANTTIIEPTSGNTGIALAFICATKKIPLILTMPESMSIERRKLLKVFGAELVLTPAAKGMGGAIEKAQELHNEIENSLLLQQFDNPDNPDAHRKTTGPELFEQTDGKIDIFVTAVGTGGTITGAGEFLQSKLPDLQIIAVEPDASPVLSGGHAGPHKIQGIGAGFVPDALNTAIYSEVLRVTNEEAMAMSRRMALDEGLLIGISAGANLCAALTLAKRDTNRHKTIVTTLCDTGERYLSTELFNLED
jgi:cysteine synthase A